MNVLKVILQGSDFILNLTVTIMMIIQTIATVFSGIEYLKKWKRITKIDLTKFKFCLNI